MVSENPFSELHIKYEPRLLDIISAIKIPGPFYIWQNIVLTFRKDFDSKISSPAGLEKMKVDLYHYFDNTLLTVGY